MNYKEKLLSLRGDAMNKIIAGSIKTAMMELRAQAAESPTAPRRWIWELIQNAKDVGYSKGIDIRIEFDELFDNVLKFSHNGQPFRADNIRFIIEKISTKDQPEAPIDGLRQSGKFGTGFISTHLLSEIVDIEGIAKEPELDYRAFNLILDRSAYDLEDIKASIQKSMDSVLNLDSFPIHENYDENNFNTSFSYRLEDDLSIQTAKSGIKDLKKCLPYTFIFLEEINSIKLTHQNLLFKNSDKPIDVGSGFKLISFHTMNTKNNECIEKRDFLFSTQNETWIASPVIQTEDGLNFLELDKSVPRLFCDFPLVGSEAFPFPVIINSPDFNPTEPRDGVFLTESSRENPQANQNKEIVIEALELYKKLLQLASDKHWGGLHHLANIKSISSPLNWVSNNWFEKSVLGPTRNILLTSKIIKSATGEYKNIRNGDDVHIWFPSAIKKEIRSSIWNLCVRWIPKMLPEEEQIEIWNKIRWSDCPMLTTTVIATTIQKKATIHELRNGLNESVYKWLNEYYRIIYSENSHFNDILAQFKIFPNQLGEFRKANSLFMDDGTIGEELKKILELLGKDMRQNLLAEEISFDLGEDRTKGISDAAVEINNLVFDITSDRDRTFNFKDGLSLLLNWLRKNEEDAQKYFRELYKKRHLLYDEETLINNSDKAEQLDDLLRDYNVQDISELKNILKEKEVTESGLLPVTEKILTQMGITNLEEWQEALKDKDIEAYFSHDSVPTHDMFVIAQGHIERAKTSVKEHLMKDPRYNLENMEEIAPTVLSDIKKDGQYISIVVRPAYKGEVIIYYGAEKDILDQEGSELWIDDGTEPSIITFGHFLKATKIRKFPV